MPKQTTKGYLKFPDGTRAVVKTKATGEMLDIGALNSAVNLTLNFTKNQITTANFGKTSAQIREMQIAGTMTLINFEAEVIEKLGGGMFTRTSVEEGTISTIDNQTISAGWVNEGKIALELVETDGGDFIPSAAPTIASVTASSSGTLTADDDYYIVEDDNSPSGYSIYFNTSGTATVAVTESIVIAYTSATAQAGQALYAGDTTEVLTAYGLAFIHRDDDDNIDYEVELYSANPESGGFQFNFKGANEDGVEEMPLSFLADIDTDRGTGRQLMKMIMPN